MSDGAPAIFHTHGRENGSQPLRVLHVTEAGVGGIRSYLCGLLPAQVSRGHDVHVLASASLPGWTNHGLPVLSGVHHRPWSLDRSRPLTVLRASNELRRTVQQLRPDVVHLHSALAGMIGRLPLLAGTSRVPVVYQPHAWSFEMVDNALFRRLMRTWEHLGSRRTDVLVANCRDEIDEGRRIGIRTPAGVLGVPLDGTRFRPQDRLDRSVARAQLGIDAHRMLVCVGRIARQKGQDQLTASWEARPLPDTALVFVGGGDPAVLRALAPTQWGRSVYAVGEHPDVRPWLWAADLLVLPSRYETVSLVAAEAMASGRPVVATRANGVAEAVVDGPLPPAGAIVPLGDMRALLDACSLRLDDPDLWSLESARALERAETSFRPSAVADRLDLSYRRAIRERAGR